MASVSPSPKVCVVLALFFLLYFFVASSGVKAQGLDLEKVTYLAPTEKDLVREMNLARTNPQQYASFLEEMKKRYQGNVYQPLKGPGIVTNEGLAAVNEAIAFLRAAKPLAPLRASGGMSLAAKDHVRDLCKTGKTGHTGSDGSITEQRVSRYGIWQNAIGENIAYDVPTAREVVMGWIVDDGSASRGHRKHLFDPNYHVVGIALGARDKTASMCVSTFAGDFVDKVAGQGNAPTLH